MIDALIVWLEGTRVSTFMITAHWAWPAVESLHFLGLTLLVGTVGLFDLRLIGVAKSISPAALHRLIPFGVAGFLINVTTGMMFLAGTPDQYLGGNAAFEFKMLFMLLAGLNVGAFYLTSSRNLKALGPGDDFPLSAKVIGATSLTLWLAIITCGRLITFYRPMTVFLQ
jgi:hypothetical protein